MIEVFSSSEPGGHLLNEDAFRVQPLDPGKEHLVCVVADGQGGRSGGDVAARVACQTCLDAAVNIPASELFSSAVWTTILRRVDEAVSTTAGAGFTTVAAFALTKIHLCGASCGDSAVAVLNDTDSGVVLTSRQSKNPPVGSGAATFVPFAARLVCPWIVLAMPDGVWKYAGWDNVFKAASENRGPAIIESIRNRARLPGSGNLQDDFTLVAFQGGVCDARLR